MTEMKFEEAIKKLEKIVEDLESGDLSLDDAIKRYEEGIKLSGLCSKKLEAIQKKVEVLIKSTQGKFQTASFDEKKISEQTESD